MRFTDLKNIIFSNKKETVILLIIILIGLFLRLYNNFYQGYWADEILTLQISNPSLTHDQMLQNWKDLDDSPILYFYFLKIFFFIFGFTAENGRIFSVIFSTLLIFISFFFFKIKYNNYTSIFGCILISLNIFLIWQSKDTRIPSSTVFFSTTNILFFYYFISRKNILKILLLCLYNIFLVSYYPFAVTIVFAQLLFLLLSEKKFFEKLKYIYFYIASLILYILINYKYFIIKIAKGSGHIGPINFKFFFNYFFSSFFGSYFLGAIFLILFFLSIYYNLKKRIKIDDIIIFHLIIIFVTYFFIIFYSLFRSEIAVPRYFIFLIPSIIFVILDLFTKKVFRKTMVIIFLITFFNTTLLLSKSSIPKPPMKELINNLSIKESNIILFNDPDYDIFLRNYKKITTNYKIISESYIGNYKKFWFVCFNNPKSIVGDLILEEEEKCKIKFNNFKEVKKLYITDFKIVLFESIN